ncbi:calcium-binding protein [Herbaspirillum sp. CAH-3]|uniref:calcium-binding protein n=1 Tax=Herbaspirillum sp. CAH-3 TaxID=2605746 RepID=UPI0012AD0D79|nr:calcium-binding protein [Herbaspirillum sp. CAH-3]MRT32184.1 hypothetical protein [Herbaspirillum sp. CAH-3]
MKKISCPLPASPAASPHRHLFERPSVPGGKGKVDTLSLTDARQDNLWFSKTGQDLRIKVLGKTDQVTVKDWYASFAAPTTTQSSWAEAQGGNVKVLLAVSH